MIRIVFGIFLVLHGLVHLLYFGQSAGYFEMQPGMTWPDGGWLFTRLAGESGNRTIACVLLVIAALGFVAAGISVLAGLVFWQTVLTSAAVFSSVLYIIFWDGGFQHLPDKGAVGILINLALLAAVYIFHWPKFDF